MSRIMLPMVSAEFHILFSMWSESRGFISAYTEELNE